jgi:hypothetical protein
MVTATKKNAKPAQDTQDDDLRPNQPPQIMAPGPVTTHPGRTVTGGFTAFDPDGDSLTFTSSGFPPNASLSTSGVVTFSPSWTQVGIFTLVVIVSDGHGGSASATWTVTVQDSPPVFQPCTPPPATAGQKHYSCCFNATDTDGDTLRWSLPGGTFGSIDPATGQFTWDVPDDQPEGTVNVTVRVEEQMNSAMCAVQTFQIEVREMRPFCDDWRPDTAREKAWGDGQVRPRKRSGK